VFGLYLGGFDTDAKISTFNFFFLSAVIRCIMAQELDYRSFVKGIKLLNDRR
jgi:hypothetical protein